MVVRVSVAEQWNETQRKTGKCWVSLRQPNLLYLVRNTHPEK
ncbi:MAG: hypothetical protein ACKO3K_18045 [Cuspidothrix sp.]